MGLAVTLSHMRVAHIETLQAFELPKEQEKYTSLPKDIGDIQEGQFPVVILANDNPVGFFLLHVTDRVKDYSDNPHAVLLTALSIHYGDQGKGYAKLGMSQVKDFVLQQFPTFNEIVLAVNHRNKAAQRLYLGVGFTDTGRRKIGKIGEQYIYHLVIKK